MNTVIGNDIKEAQYFLEKGELVAIPTETVYGLAANAMNDEAVIKIYNAKNRPQFNPLIIHVPNIESISKYAYLDNLSTTLANAFMPGPFTLLLPKKQLISDVVTAGSTKVAVRIPKHALTQALLQQLAFPVAAPSANPSGYVSPTTAEHVYKGLNGKIPYILDGGATSVGLESTIVEVQNQEVVVHRVGGVNVEAIEAIIGKPVVFQLTHQQPNTPGQLKSHYATTTPLLVGNVEQLLTKFEGKKIGIISFSKSYANIPSAQQFILSPNADLAEAAKNLFSVMRLMDEKNLDIVLAEKFPNEGLGRAINDRLNRAQHFMKEV